MVPKIETSKELRAPGKLRSKRESKEEEEDRYVFIVSTVKVEERRGFWSFQFQRSKITITRCFLFGAGKSKDLPPSSKKPT